MSAPMPEFGPGCNPSIIPMGIALVSTLKLFALHLPVAYASWTASATLLKKDGRLVRALAAGLIYFLLIEVGTLLAPRVSFEWLLAWSMLAGAGGVVLRLLGRDEETPLGGNADFASLAGGAGVALFAAFILARGVFFPRFDDDPLIYQLHFAASWLHAQKISIVPTPFHDPSQAYGPGLASIYYLWLMAPLGNDLMAQTGALPFLALALIAACALSGELGVKRNMVWSAGAFALASPLFLYEGVSAYSDLPLAAFFTGSIFFLARAAREGRGADLGLGLLAAGLTWASKYTAAQLTIPLLPLVALAAVKVRGREALLGWSAGLAAAAAACGYWYARNVMISGNPFFPITISIGSWTIFPGMFGAEEMRDWVFHQEGIRAWFAIVTDNVNPIMLAIGALSMAAVCVGALRKTKTGAHALALAWVALVPLVVDRLNWSVSPFQVDRFWLPALPVLAAVTAAFVSRSSTMLVSALALSWAGLVLPLGTLPEGGYWSFVKVGVLLCAAGGLVAAKAAPAIGRVTGSAMKSRALIVCSGLAFIFLVTAIGQHSYFFKRIHALSKFSYGPGWLSLPCKGRGLKIAYTGANMSYPLHGPRLDNDVVYIAPSGLAPTRTDRVLAEQYGDKSPSFNTPEPAIKRLELCPEKWAERMVAQKVSYFFVMRVSRTALINTAHSPEGWPIEDGWAQQLPGLFKLIHHDELVRIYKLMPENAAEAGLLSDKCTRRPADAIAACDKSRKLCRRYFPKAEQALRDLEKLRMVYSLTF